MAPAFFNPKVITVHSNKPMKPGHRKAVLDMSSSAIKIWLYPALPSRKLMTLCPEASLISISAIGMGYSSLGVALFKSLKSIHTLNLPEPFFSTGKMLEIQSAYLQGLIKLALSKQPISSLIQSYVFGLNFLADCL